VLRVRGVDDDAAGPLKSIAVGVAAVALELAFTEKPATSYSRPGSSRTNSIRALSPEKSTGKNGAACWRRKASSSPAWQP